MSLLSLVVPLLAAAAPSPSPSPVVPPDAAKVSPGLLGFVSWIFLLAAGYVIWRSMSKQMKRISFPDPEDDRDRRRIPHRVPHAPVEDQDIEHPARPATAWSPSPRTPAPGPRPRPPRGRR